MVDMGRTPPGRTTAIGADQPRLASLSRTGSAPPRRPDALTTIRGLPSMDPVGSEFRARVMGAVVVGRRTSGALRRGATARVIRFDATGAGRETAWVFGAVSAWARRTGRGGSATAVRTGAGAGARVKRATSAAEVSATLVGTRNKDFGAAATWAERIGCWAFTGSGAGPAGGATRSAGAAAGVSTTLVGARSKDFGAAVAWAKRTGCWAFTGSGAGPAAAATRGEAGAAVTAFATDGASAFAAGLVQRASCSLSPANRDAAAGSGAFGVALGGAAGLAGVGSAATRTAIGWSSTRGGVATCSGRMCSGERPAARTAEAGAITSRGAGAGTVS